MEQRLIAFWKYDVPPYVLAGEIVEFTSDGKVRIKEYDGMVLNPIKILPYEDGIEIKNKIYHLGVGYRQKEGELLAEIKNATNALLKIMQV